VVSVGIVRVIQFSYTVR